MFDVDLMGKPQNFDKQKKHYTKDGKYFISTNLTWDHGWETMVFSLDPGTRNVDYSEVDVNHYNDETEAFQGHINMIEKWEAKV